MVRVGEVAGRERQKTERAGRMKREKKEEDTSSNHPKLHPFNLGVSNADSTGAPKCDSWDHSDNRQTAGVADRGPGAPSEPHQHQTPASSFGPVCPLLGRKRECMPGSCFCLLGLLVSLLPGSEDSLEADTGQVIPICLGQRLLLQVWGHLSWAAASRGCSAVLGAPSCPCQLRYTWIR